MTGASADVARRTRTGAWVISRSRRGRRGGGGRRREVLHRHRVAGLRVAAASGERTATALADRDRLAAVGAVDARGLRRLARGQRAGGDGRGPLAVGVARAAAEGAAEAAADRRRRAALGARRELHVRVDAGGR